jgi:MerR family transcriptional regulator, repressor of the yfmOP operon
MTATLETLYSIDEVARMTGLTARTLRFYEEVGLLDPPARTEGGHRKYRDADVHRIERIKELKELLGYSLADLQTILRATEQRGTLREAYQQDSDPAHQLAQVAAAYALLSEQVEVVQSRIDRLTRVRGEYEDRQHRLEAERNRLQALLTMHEEGR